MIKIVRFFMKLFWIFKIDNKKIFFSAYEGKQFSCNPKEIYSQVLKDHYFDDFKFVWELNTNVSLGNVSHTSYVKHNSIRCFFEIMTSKYIITNTGITGKIPLRKCQININTWHGGGAYKRVGYATKNTLNANYNNLDYIINQTKYFLSSSRIFTDVMVKSLHMPRNRFLNVGMPRNDVFFQSERCKKINRKVRARYNIGENDFIVIYAPTYRGGIGENNELEQLPDFEALRCRCEKKFGKRIVIMIRMHYFNSMSINAEQCIAVSDYPDMQDLLVASDMLITDYSSSMWDYALTYKPCILFMPDYNNYDSERGFYTPVETWPGLICFTNSEMINAIEKYNQEAYNLKIKKYLKNTGNYETGKATLSVLDILKK